MFWNGSLNEASVGSMPAAARSGKNGVIQICGRLLLTSRTPKLRWLDTVTQNIGVSPEPSVCANGAQRPHELNRPLLAFAAVSWIGGAEPSAFITHSCALMSLYAPLVLLSSERLNRTHLPS